MKVFKKSNGFTLIELMVVITIIAIMFGVVISSASFLRSSSGDAKRKADLAQLQSSLQNYYADLNYFPHVNSPGGFILSGSNPSTVLDSTKGIASPAPSPAPVTKTYLKKIDIDPDAPFCYVPVRDSVSNNPDCDNTFGKRCNFYYLAIALENPTNPETFPISGKCANTNYIVTP